MSGVATPRQEVDPGGFAPLPPQGTGYLLIRFLRSLSKGPILIAELPSFRWEMNHITKLLGIVLVLILFASCTTMVEDTSNPYADPKQWLSLPLTEVKPVDVFYLYPTVYVRENPSGPLYSERKTDILQNAAAMAYKLQATAFEPAANVYAPFYRQCDPAAVLTLPFEKRDVLLEEAPLQDAIAAFDYYIQRYNNGRPFVLAGHSQGSDVLRLLLATYMPEHPEVYERMIAAYCIGTSITTEFLAEYPFLRFAEHAEDTQVIVSYNTEAPGVTEANPLVSKDALVINPLSWTRSEEPAGIERNLGSAILDATGTLLILPGFADAKVDLDRSVVLCSTVEGKLPVLASSAHLPKGVYHSFDYSLYYANLSENINQRIAVYFNKQNR